MEYNRSLYFASWLPLTYWEIPVHWSASKPFCRTPGKRQPNHLYSAAPPPPCRPAVCHTAAQLWRYGSMPTCQQSGSWSAQSRELKTTQNSSFCSSSLCHLLVILELYNLVPSYPGIVLCWNRRICY